MKTLLTYLTEKNWDTYAQNKYEDPIKSAIFDYVAGYTCGVNDDLRKLKNRGSKNVIKNLDAAFDSEYASKGKIDVYRTVKDEYLENVYKLNKDNVDSMIDKEFENKGFMSTTFELHSPWGSNWYNDDVIMHITSKKDESYLDINKIFPNDDEIDCTYQKEYLLPRNVKMKLTSYSIKTKKDNKQFTKEGNLVLEMEII